MAVIGGFPNSGTLNAVYSFIDTQQTPICMGLRVPEKHLKKVQRKFREHHFETFDSIDDMINQMRHVNWKHKTKRYIREHFICCTEIDGLKVMMAVSGDVKAEGAGVYMISQKDNEYSVHFYAVENNKLVVQRPKKVITKPKYRMDLGESMTVYFLRCFKFGKGKMVLKRVKAKC